MELYENRIINGLLKDVEGIADPEAAARRLAVDCAILAPAERARMDDLWPCIWALASVLKRQFSGRVYLDCGLAEALPCPADLGPRCRFGAPPPDVTVHVVLGMPRRGHARVEVVGDARGATVALAPLSSSLGPAHATAGFALAGHLGFAALAGVAGIPPYHSDLVVPSINLSLPNKIVKAGLPDLSVIGVGHLGQAYLALLFFMVQQDQVSQPKLVLLDKDRFEAPNAATQILLEDDAPWIGQLKAPYIAERLRDHEFNVVGSEQKIQWGWKRPDGHPDLALLGLDDLEVRQMAAAPGYTWLIEAGLGASFERPRVTWHSLPGDPALAREFFAVGGPKRVETLPAKRFHEDLRGTPGRCGWITFQAVTASAPSMGLVAAAHVGTELLNYAAGDSHIVNGAALLWDQLLPVSRDVRTYGAQRRPA